MTNKQILKMSASDIIKQFACVSLDDFNDSMEYEIKKQYTSNANSSNK